MSRRFRSIGELLASALRLLAIYAIVRAALRAVAVHYDKAGQIPQPERGPRPERLREHSKSGLEAHGGAESLAEPAARTVHSVRAPAGEARSLSLLSTTDLSPPTGGGHRSHRGVAGRTYRQLYEEARRRGVRGRSKMSKAALEAALVRPKTGTSGGS